MYKQTTPPREDGDSQKVESWRKALAEIDIVFHLAAQTSAAYAEKNPFCDRKDNVDPLRHLVEEASRLPNPPIVVFSSTDTVAGLLNGVVDDKTIDQPRTVYDLHKLCAEKILEWGTRRGFVKGVTLRLTTLYGPGGDVSKSDRGVINKMITRALNGKDLTLYGNGECYRDLLYIEDAITAICTSAEQVESLKGDHFVVGTGDSATLREIFETIVEATLAVTGQKVAIENVPWPSASLDIDRRSVKIDASRFYKLTDWSPRYSFKKTIFDTIRKIAEE